MAATMEEPGPWSRTIAELGAETTRVARRLRGLTAARLRRPLPPYGTVADAGRALAQVLADATQGVEDRAGAPCPRRSVPRLSDLAAGEQVAVTADDLLAALAPLGPYEQVWIGEERGSAHRLAASTLARATEIKLAID